ncbi:porin [Fibrella sp. HMF5335]|uniref:Porin n=1 Tax=Fibrella rubiginis TaxID=2817060 RepID=A0A939K3Y8_9BACT|nr:porin [Fibrella rubiginis]MBO0936128.1 porin [Fibrella rubiginis]
MKKQILLAFSVSAGFAAQAGDTTDVAKPKAVSAVATTAPKEGEDTGKFTFSGYLDFYYLGNFNNPIDRMNTGVNGSARAFDQRAGQFQLGIVQAKASYTSEKVDAVMDLAFGNNADLGNYGNTVSLNSGAATSTALAIKQAYLTLKATSKLSFTAGQFGTHIGYEVIDAPVNYNYSLSNLFNNGPFYHLGVKAQYAISDKASLMVGLVNNIDRSFDNNRAKGFIAQLALIPVSGWNIYLNTAISNEANVRTKPDAAVGTDTTGTYSIFDLTTTYQITPKFFLGLNAAYGSQTGGYQQLNPYATGTYVDKSTSWGGVAIYSNYAVSDKFGLGARYEVFDNTGGARALVAADGTGVSVNSVTITGNITTGNGHVLLKPEFRVDSYSKNKFINGDGKLTKSQTTLGMAAIFKF